MPADACLTHLSLHRERSREPSPHAKVPRERSTPFRVKPDIAGGNHVGTIEDLSLVPSAPLDDPQWQTRPHQGEVIVRARTAGDARLWRAKQNWIFWKSTRRLPRAIRPSWQAPSKRKTLHRDRKQYRPLHHGRTPWCHRRKGAGGQYSTHAGGLNSVPGIGPLYEAQSR